MPIPSFIPGFAFGVEATTRGAGFEASSAGGGGVNTAKPTSALGSPTCSRKNAVMATESGSSSFHAAKSADCNSRASAKRFSGSFASDFSIRSDRSFGNSGVLSEAGCCCSLIIPTASSLSSVPPNGIVPVAAAYIMIPNEKTSDRASTSLPRNCSGLMNFGVPMSWPAPVKPSTACSPRSFATPKSSSFTNSGLFPFAITKTFSNLRSR